MSVPEVHYTRSGDVPIAYQVVGDGPMDIVFVRDTLADLLAAWDQPLFVDHVEGLASFARVILFDKRVHTRARVAALADPGEVLVSSTMKDLVAGSGIEFEERGEHELKGISGKWRLYAVRDA